MSNYQYCKKGFIGKLNICNVQKILGIKLVKQRNQFSLIDPQLLRDGLFLIGTAKLLR